MDAVRPEASGRLFFRLRKGKLLNPEQPAIYRRKE